MLFGLDRHQPVALHPVEDLYDENNETVLDWEGNPIRDYPFLPRYIASRPPAWLLEYWARTDPRLSYKDIKARMTTEPRSRPSENTLNMRREREVRGPLGLSCWNRRRGAVTRVEVERVERWSLEQLAYNTAMTIEYDTDGQPARLRSKALVRNGSGPGVTNIGQPTFPLDTFLRRGDTTHTPGQRLRETLALYTRLSGRARELGLDSWQLLPTDELPQGWNRLNSINRFTYDYFLNQGKFCSYI